MFCIDVGSIVKEQINLLERGGNYGWPLFEGDICLVDNHTCEAGKLHLCTYKELHTAHRADVIEIFYKAGVRSEMGWHMAIVMNLYIL